MKHTISLIIICLLISCDSKQSCEIKSNRKFADLGLKLLEEFETSNNSFFLFYRKEDSDFGKLYLTDQHDNFLDSVSIVDNRAFEVIKTDSLEFEFHYDWRSSIVYAESVIPYKINQTRLIPLINYTKSYFTKSISYENVPEIRIDYIEEISSCEVLIRNSPFCGNGNTELFSSKVELRYDSLNTPVLADTVVERLCLRVDPSHGVYMERYMGLDEIKSNGLDSNNQHIPYCGGRYFDGKQWEILK